MIIGNAATAPPTAAVATSQSMHDARRSLRRYLHDRRPSKPSIAIGAAARVSSALSCVTSQAAARQAHRPRLDRTQRASAPCRCAHPIIIGRTGHHEETLRRAARRLRKDAGGEAPHPHFAYVEEADVPGSKSCARSE